jgi:hypothetical protein
MSTNEASLLDVSFVETSAVNIGCSLESGLRRFLSLEIAHKADSVRSAIAAFCVSPNDPPPPSFVDAAGWKHDEAVADVLETSAESDLLQLPHVCLLVGWLVPSRFGDGVMNVCT